ncbi:IclR family transcriptional regulator [Gluconacetobacter sacchari]|uniref:IclR family transcriptional regulator n=1 Tax=Gluconacetobacter sacchari TaxID=92759 RepID=A0A7W4NRG6_9PROT|nr:IclR family transcriptional regulator [Gluconacetobacter sacchari]MBB2160155.1 IclR family transcriptional regulator [Gluconacetobacter sacchari]
MGAHDRISAGGGHVPALRRAVAILDYISASSEAPTLSGLARALGLPKSTAHGLVQAMEELGLLARAADGTLRTGPHSLRWAGDFLARTDLVSAFRQSIAESWRSAQFTVTMTVLDGNEVVYIACSEANRPLDVAFRIGMRLPAPFTATGKALLAARPDRDLDALFARGFPAPLTRYSVASMPDLRRELAETRQRGFSIDDGQIREGLFCLGATVGDHAGQAVAALALSLTRSEASPDMVAMLGRSLMDAAADLSRRLGAG